MREPKGIQMQDFLQQPFKFQTITRRSKFEAEAKSFAYWQIRICNLFGCIANTHLNQTNLRFNLELRDPIERYLDETSSWQGLSGDYVLYLGPDSEIREGQDEKLPTLSCSINALSRLWFGILPASGLMLTEDISGPPDLIRNLDEAFRLPQPGLDWDF